MAWNGGLSRFCTERAAGTGASPVTSACSRSLHECEAFLKSKDIILSRADLLKLYMVLGGIPYYLNLMSRGESVSGVIDRLFFSDPPELKGEFDELFDSLFDNSPVHKRIISLVAGTKAGLTRTEIASRAKLPSGGNLNRYIDNLEQSGFLEEHDPLGSRGKKDVHYRVCDMFTAVSAALARG